MCSSLPSLRYWWGYTQLRCLSGSGACSVSSQGRLSALCSPYNALRSRRALFEECALASVTHSSGPASAEAERRLKSWGSQMDLAERLETGSSFSSSSPARSSAHSLEMEAHSETVSSTPREGSGSRYLPLRTRLVRSSIETRLWI